MPSLTSLAEEILANAKRLDEHLASQEQPSPSFDRDALINLPPQLESARNVLIDSTHTLKQLAQGPVLATIDIMFYVHIWSIHWIDSLSLRAVYAYKLPQAVPIDGSATYQEIASARGISESTARRFLRHAMTNGVFAQSSANRVRHTAASRLMVTDPDFFDAYGDSGEPNETAFSLANNTDLDIYRFLGQNPDRARRFGAGMRFFSKDEGWNLKHLVAGFDWASIDYPGATIVDMGGGHGSVSQVLAKATKHAKFVILDLPGTVEQGRAALPKEYDGRIEFVAHDFFAEQPQAFKKTPTIYFFRWIFHNWSDRYCVRILRNLIPSLDDGTRVLIYDHVLNDDPEMRLTEKFGLNSNIIMAACFNGAERTKAQWIDLLRSADERFVVQSIVRPEGGMLSVIEIVWRKS